MKFYLDAENSVIITVVGDKGVPVAEELVRMGMAIGAHRVVINNMIKQNNEGEVLSDTPIPEGRHYYVGLTLEEALDKCEAIEL